MNENAIERECPICGKVYLADPRRLRWGRQTTCSRRCSYLLRADKLQDKIRVTCGFCGREFERSPSQIKGKHGSQFCSRACHYAGRSTGSTRRVVSRPYVVSDAARESWKAGALKTVRTRRERDNYRHSDEARAKISIATARSIAERKPFAPSKLEDKVALELNRLGINYIRQFVFRDPAGRFAFVVDFWLPDTRSVIEVNGTYWHADPRVYPAPGNETQKRNVSSYGRKLDSLREMSIRVAEVWEMDFKRNPSQAVLAAYQVATGG